MDDLAGRLAHRVQLTTDGHRVYLQAVENAFGAAVDYAMLVKIYGNDSRAPDTGAIVLLSASAPQKPLLASLDVRITAHISTSHVERQNLTMRMKMRRFTHLNERILQEG